ncbi:hypothetical protein ACEZCY_14490 [Streptacidiphilus sp. N1-12]
MSAPTEPPAALPEPDIPDKYAPPACGECGQLLVVYGSGRTVHPLPCEPRHHDTG